MPTTKGRHHRKGQRGARPRTSCSARRARKRFDPRRLLCRGARDQPRQVEEDTSAPRRDEQKSRHPPQRVKGWSHPRRGVSMMSAWVEILILVGNSAEQCDERTFGERRTARADSIDEVRESKLRAAPLPTLKRPVTSGSAIARASPSRPSPFVDKIRTAASDRRGLGLETA